MGCSPGRSSFALALVSFTAFGAMGLLFFVAQAIGAILHLEVINYIEHYGLAQAGCGTATTSGGRAPPWNSAYFISNAYLFQLQRHSITTSRRAHV